MQFVSTLVDQATIQSFLNAGFVPKKNDNDPDAEVYLSKNMICSQLPYVDEHIVDDDWIFSDDKCAVDLLPDGSIQLVIFNPDYCEQYSKNEHPDEWLQMAKDAGVVFATVES